GAAVHDACAAGQRGRGASAGGGPAEGRRPGQGRGTRLTAWACFVAPAAAGPGGRLTRNPGPRRPNNSLPKEAAVKHQCVPLPVTVAVVVPLLAFVLLPRR